MQREHAFVCVCVCVCVCVRACVRARVNDATDTSPAADISCSQNSLSSSVFNCNCQISIGFTEHLQPSHTCRSTAARKKAGDHYPLCIAL